MTGLEAAIPSPPAPAALPARSRRPGILLLFNHLVPYASSWAFQQQVHAERLSGSRPDTLMLLEHLPVYTVGRRTKPAHYKPRVASLNDLVVPFETVNRGGSVTYHGPGQLVAYPIVALRDHALGAKAYVHMLEEVVIRTLLRWEIRGYRVLTAPGVWTLHQQREVKIASVGARIDRGITLHGFALNVNNDLSPFSRIVPCGIDGCRMTSMDQIRKTSIALPLVAETLAEVFSTVFHLRWTTTLTDMRTTTGSEAEADAAAT